MAHYDSDLRYSLKGPVMLMLFSYVRMFLEIFFFIFNLFCENIMGVYNVFDIILPYSPPQLPPDIPTNKFFLKPH